MKEECMISQENYRLTTEEFIKAQTNLKEAQKNYDNTHREGMAQQSNCDKECQLPVLQSEAQTPGTACP